MRLLDSKEIKNIELSLLISFNKLAEQNGLWYSLAFGTLLGAVRHKGFIPWDDDIDVMMPRVDYERLLSILKSQNEIEYRVIEDNNSHFPYLKLVDTRITVEYNCSKASETDYLWIDVFPIDYIPNSKRKSELYFAYVKLLRMCLMLSKLKVGTGTTWYKRIIKIPFCIVPKMLGARFWGHRINEFCKKSSNTLSKYCGILCWGYGSRQKMPKAYYLQRDKVRFEGREYWALGGWHEYLTDLYGDYMQLPPVEKRVAHSIKAWIIEDE